MTRWLPLLCLAVAMGAPRAVAAQVLQGRLLDDVSGAPLSGAEVVAVNEAGEPRARSFTDPAGRFELDLPQPGVYRLRATHLGHATYTSEPLELARSASVHVELRMGVEAIPIEPLRVIARRSPEDAHLVGFNERRRDPGQVGGYFLTRDDIDRRTVATPSQLLQQVPGVMLRQVITPEFPMGLDRNLITLPGTRTSAPGGGCFANVFIDGVVMRQGTDHTIDDLLEPGVIAGIEVYPRANSAPIQYRLDSLCGVVLIWTRRPQGEGGSSIPRMIVGAVVIATVVLFGFLGGGG